jgi:hypothetical protein
MNVKLGNKNKFYGFCCIVDILIHRFNVCVMVFNTNFNDISVITWQSVLLVGETGVQ